jgi:hypothetical protein
MPPVAIAAVPNGKLHAPYSMQWSLGIEHQFGATAKLQAQYVGTHAVDQPYLTQVNGYQTVCQGCFAPFPYMQPTDMKQKLTENSHCDWCSGRGHFTFKPKEKAITVVLECSVSQNVDTAWNADFPLCIMLPIQLRGFRPFNLQRAQETFWKGWRSEQGRFQREFTSYCKEARLLRATETRRSFSE